MNIKIFKNKKSFKKTSFQMNSDIYWKVILYSVFVIIALSFVFGFFVFTQTNKDSVLLNENLNKDKTINKDRIEKVLKYFSDRKEKSLNILNSPTGLVDPSL